MARVIQVFTIEHNRPEALLQEYDLAWEHFREMSLRRRSERDAERFQAARDRLDLARDLRFDWARNLG